jgi:hypothetical protein
MIAFSAPQGVKHPGHHEGDLVLTDIITVTPHARGKSEVPKGGELTEHEDYLGKVHDTLLDGER